MAAPSWRCLTPEDGDLDGSFGQQNGGTIQEERGLSFLLKQEDREIQDSYLHLFNKLDIAVKEMKQYVIQINKWVENPVCMPESNPDKMEALTSENTLCLLALTVILLDSFTHVLALQLLAGCVERAPVQDPPTYILLHLTSTASVLLTIYSSVRIYLVPTVVLEFHIDIVPTLEILSVIRQTKQNLWFQAAFFMALMFSFPLFCLFLIMGLLGV